MASKLSVPEVGDFLKFLLPFSFIPSDSDLHLSIKKGSKAKVIDRIFTSENGDEVTCILLISLDIGNETRLFKFNYTIHQNSVELITKSQATALLYG